jgi:hypothetical protein
MKTNNIFMLLSSSNYTGVLENNFFFLVKVFLFLSNKSLKICPKFPVHILFLFSQLLQLSSVVEISSKFSTPVSQKQKDFY